MLLRGESYVGQQRSRENNNSIACVYALLCHPVPLDLSASPPPGAGFVQARTWVRGDTKPPRGGRGFRAYPHTQGRPSLCGMSAR